MPGTEKQNNMFEPSTGYIQKNNPFPVTSCGRRRNHGSPLTKRKHFRSVEQGAGMTEAGIAAYKSENPGSKLKSAVTGDVKAGSKAAKRRKSFCARSKGWTGERGKAARRRWKC